MVKNLVQETQVWFLGGKDLLEKIPWRREWLPTPVLLPGEFHGQRSLVGFSPWGHKESDTTEGLMGTYIYTPVPTVWDIPGLSPVLLK